MKKGIDYPATGSSFTYSTNHNTIVGDIPPEVSVFTDCGDARPGKPNTQLSDEERAASVKRMAEIARKYRIPLSTLGQIGFGSVVDVLTGAASPEEVINRAKSNPDNHTSGEFR